jgi:hypothetical protein
MTNSQVTNANLNEYVAVVQEKMNEYWERQGFQKNLGNPDTISIIMGKKFAKVIHSSDPSVTHRNTKSVHSFINMQNGDIVKAGSWKAPARNGVRGNIFSADKGARVVNQYGVNYIR